MNSMVKVSTKKGDGNVPGPIRLSASSFAWTASGIIVKQNVIRHFKVPDKLPVAARGSGNCTVYLAFWETGPPQSQAAIVLLAVWDV